MKQLVLKMWRLFTYELSKRLTGYYQSKKPNNKEYTLKEYLITSKRNRRINDLINKAVKMILDIALQKQVKEIVVGYNKNFKTGGIKTKIKGKLKKQLNQNFTQIPLSKIKQKIKEKCIYENIIYTEINESYTSKCSFYDNKEIGYHQTYLGKRITRSLYETKEKRIINANVNAALNILKKRKTDRIEIIESLRNIGLTIPSRLKIKN